ncbi:VOC family protein [Variovorax sp. OV329]|uniref:VOC family protein n=1 Tax=Variovorax sp. OV329 TaxID=1882825 RepID=UPI0008EC0B2D|nr:VOC family protein [Variovorax sp. OV329]SFM92183.1 Catechol 2,3-dioxygenase [Variovorax sp. OV329]
MLCKKLHHAAFRCKDAAATTRFYTGVLGLKFSHAITQEAVPSTGQHCPHIHIFFEMQDGSSIAFFECPTAPGEVKDMVSPAWIQHFAFQVDSEEVLRQAQAELEHLGVPVVGPVNHDDYVLSIYFADPSGHRLELTTPICPPGRLKEFAARAPGVLEEWTQRRAPSRPIDIDLQPMPETR